MTAKTILLVEDNIEDVHLICYAIQACGSDLRPWVEPDGAKALTFLRKDPP